MPFQYQSAVKICGSDDLPILGGQDENLSQSELVGEHPYAVRLLLREGDRVGRRPIGHVRRRHRPWRATLTETTALPELVGLLVPASCLAELPSADQGSQRVVDRVLVVLFPLRSSRSAWSVPQWRERPRQVLPEVPSRSIFGRPGSPGSLSFEAWVVASAGPCKGVGLIRQVVTSCVFGPNLNQCGVAAAVRRSSPQVSRTSKRSGEDTVLPRLTCRYSRCHHRKPSGVGVVRWYNLGSSSGH